MSFDSEVSELERLLETDGFIKFRRMGLLYDIDETDTSDAAMIRKLTRPAKVPTAPRRSPHGSHFQQRKQPRGSANHQAGGKPHAVRDGRGRTAEAGMPYKSRAIINTGTHSQGPQGAPSTIKGSKEGCRTATSTDTNAKASDHAEKGTSASTNTGDRSAASSENDTSTSTDNGTRSVASAGNNSSFSTDAGAKISGNTGSGTSASTNTSAESTARLHVGSATQRPTHVACGRARWRHRIVPRRHHAIPRTRQRETILCADAPRGAIRDCRIIDDDDLFGFPVEKRRRCDANSIYHHRHIGATDI